MARRDRYNLTPEQERFLMEIRERVVQLTDGINAFGTNTRPYEIAQSLIKDTEKLLGY